MNGSALGFAFGFATGALIGFFVARVGIPSFVVTLGLFLGFQGLALVIIGPGGLYRLQVPELRAIQSQNLPDWGGWVMLAIMLLIAREELHSGIGGVVPGPACPIGPSRSCS